MVQGDYVNGEKSIGITKQLPGNLKSNSHDSVLANDLRSDMKPCSFRAMLERLLTAKRVVDQAVLKLRYNQKNSVGINHSIVSIISNASRNQFVVYN